MHRWRAVAGLACFCLWGLAPVSAGAADPSAACSVAWGVFVDGSPAALEPLTQLEAAVGRRAVIVHWYQGWQPDDNPTLDSQQLQAVRSHGSWPFISWEPQGVPLADITSGQWDEYIDRWATALADYGDPVLLAPLAGMDDAAHSYAWNAGDNTPDAVVAAWRHIHDRFATDGTANVLWVFDAPRQATAPVEQLYPGDTEVDWLGIDAYNGGRPLGQAWTPLTDLVNPVYERLEAINTDKPVMLAEFGSVEEGGDKAAWLQDAGQKIPGRFPQVKAVAYFNAVDPKRADVDWRLETSPASLAAARATFGPGTAYCVTAAGLTGDGSTAAEPGPFRRTLSLAIPLLAITLLFLLGISASKLRRPRF